MNKYFVKIPYSYVRYGTLSAFVYAEDEEEAEDLAYDCDNRQSEDYEDGDDCGSNEYNYSDMTVELEEEDVDSPDDENRLSALQQSMLLPCNYSKDLVLL
ncbi:MAG: hypothetical protein PHN88_04600 [Ignavibacteria bacterium]|nr:hypothetical protein [Ignavibacteria bacterium]